MDTTKLIRLGEANKAAITKLTADITDWVTSATQDAIKAKRNSLKKALTNISSYINNMKHMKIKH